MQYENKNLYQIKIFNKKLKINIIKKFIITNFYYFII